MPRSDPTALDDDHLEPTEHANAPRVAGDAYLFGITEEGGRYYYDSERDRVVQNDAEGSHVEDHDVGDGIKSFIDDVEDRVGWDLIGSDDDGDERSSGN